MIEWVIFPIGLAVAAFLPKGKGNDKKTIETIFKNTGYGIKKKDKLETPIYKRKEVIKDGEEIIGMTYYYSIPKGLPATKLAAMEKDLNLFSDGLGKPAEVEFSRKEGLMVRVFNEELSDHFPYDAIPERKDDFWVAIGKALDGIVWHNFSHTPHMTIAGTTRFGKSVQLRCIMTYLIEMHQDNVEFYIIDLKGGLEFNRYKKIRQVKEVAKDAKEALLLLEYITNEDLQIGPKGILEKDYELYLKNDWSNTSDSGSKKRRFIIVDEGAQLTPQKHMSREDALDMIACQTKLAKIAGVAGGIGYSIIFATQYPTSDTLPRLVKQNADAKTSFRLPSGYGSEVAIDERGAEKLPSNIKGRALYKTHVLKELQAPILYHNEMWEKLEKFQNPTPLEGVPENVIEVPTKTDSPGTDIEQFGRNEVRDTGPITKNPSVRFEPERVKTFK